MFERRSSARLWRKWQFWRSFFYSVSLARSLTRLLCLFVCLSSCQTNKQTHKQTNRQANKWLRISTLSLVALSLFVSVSERNQTKRKRQSKTFRFVCLFLCRKLCCLRIARQADRQTDRQPNKQPTNKWQQTNKRHEHCSARLVCLLVCCHKLMSARWPGLALFVCLLCVRPFVRLSLSFVRSFVR